MKISILSALLILACAGSAAALSCNDKPNRYRNRDVFATVKQTSNIQFGQNKNPLYNNASVNLFMDVFEPVGDSCTKRPLIIFMWGGGFKTGTRKDETGTCQQFAKRGFTCVTSDYRMGVNGVDNPTNFGTPAFMSTQDTRAAVRFLRKNAALYSIDTGFIYVGGCSSGGYAAMWTGYLDQLSEIPDVVDKAALDGGIEGNSGNPGYSSKIAGVLSLSGAVHDTLWINKGDVAFAAVQCSADPTVHPEGGIGAGSKMQYYGGTAFSARATHIGLPHALKTFTGACHCPRPIGPTGVDSTVDFFAKSVYEFMTAPTTRIRPAVAFSPRDLETVGETEWVDVRGQRVRLKVPAGAARVPAFRPGLYFPASR
ncbi:MAG: hypothetical protein JWO30_4147 [Fibrobacteres bacterium]|nr:hypothetical protein [Fibrobacterota bacterium]